MVFFQDSASSATARAQNSGPREIRGDCGVGLFEFQHDERHIIILWTTCAPLVAEANEGGDDGGGGLWCKRGQGLEDPLIIQHLVLWIEAFGQAVAQS